ncbi:MAG: hypothetical protein R2831_06800 [Chitinophagaceae bacterium]
MKSVVLSIYELGNHFGYFACWAYIIIMFVGLLFVMKNYLKED